MSIETGGPAFPQDLNHGNNGLGYPVITSQGGMTLRDYFAFGMMKEYMPKYPRDIAAAMCYLDADAMIKERNKG